MEESASPSLNRMRVPLAILVPALGVALALWFFRTALLPFFVAIVLAYLMEPLASRLARHMRRGWAALLAILAFSILWGLILWMMVPPLVAQVERLCTSLPGWRDQAMERWMPWLNAHPAVLAKARQAMDAIDPMAFLQDVRVAGMGVLRWLLGLMALVLVPLIVYYLLVEGPDLIHWLDEMIPVRYRERVRSVVMEINHRLGGYIRGELAVALVMSFLQGLGFQILGVPYPWVLGLVAGLANGVPYSPYVTALPLALFFSAVNGAGWVHILVLVVVFELIQKAEAFYFTPVWVGKASGLHPLEVLLAIFCFGFAFGILGLVFAVPLMIMFKTLSRALVANYKSSSWFNN